MLRFIVAVSITCLALVQTSLATDRTSVTGALRRNRHGASSEHGGSCWLEAAKKQEAAESNIMRFGQILRTNKKLVAGDTHMIMQSDCNLVIYRKGGKHVWASDTHGRGRNCVLFFAPGNGCGRKGDLVILNDRGHVRWHIPSGVISPIPSELTLLPSHRAALLQPNGNEIWDTYNVNEVMPRRTSWHARGIAEDEKLARALGK